MGISDRIRRALRGDVSARAAVLEAGRRGLVAFRQSRERAALRRALGSEGGAHEHARLAGDYARMSGAELLEHFRSRSSPRFFEGFGEIEDEGGRVGNVAGSGELEEEARGVIAHRWPLLGYGVLDFGEEIDWLREPVSGVRWPLEYHCDVRLVRGDGSDVRVLWELNRLGQLLTLGRAYASTREEAFAEEFFAQVESWRARNPVGFGPNWSCAMEAALRATNLLAAFELFRRSRALDESRLGGLLALFDAHGRHVRRNLEYSYIATGNHYLSDVAGLLWLGLCLPELEAARGWRAFALRELLRELDVQVLPDGADCEASTGYHRLVTELFLYSLILCRANRVEIEERHWSRVRSMLEYVRAYLRPDGRAPLVGDTDSGQVLPLLRRDADDHAHLLAVGAVVFKESNFKLYDEAPPEVAWLLGAEGVRAYEELETTGPRAAASAVFEHAGTCVLREGDMYLMLNASGAGLKGRGAHGHNDALSIEVFACGVSFIADPGTYVYTSDLRARHEFRSTAYHSTVEVDGVEQNTTDERTPFQLGDDTRPRVLAYFFEGWCDVVSTEHEGYRRLTAGPVTHRRSVIFDGRERYWLVRDSFVDEGEDEREHEHDFRFVFHAAPGREVRTLDASAYASATRECVAVELADDATGARLVVVSLEGLGGVNVEPRWSSRGYGSKVETAAAVWKTRASVPFVANWLLLPVRAGEDLAARLELIERVREEWGGEDDYDDWIPPPR